MDIVDIRRKQLAAWFADKPLPPLEKSYISQLINGKSSFGEKAARRIELQYGMSPGYLDDASAQPVAVANQTVPLYDSGGEWVEIGLMSNKLGCGPATLLEYDSLIGKYPVPKRILDQFGVSAADCRMLQVSGDSMAPYVDDGGYVLVNTKDITIKNGAVYAVRDQEVAMVKRLFRQMDGRVRVESYNKDYGDEYLTPDREGVILGRVIWRAS